MKTTRDDRMELLGSMKALATFPATSEVDKTASEIVIPAVIVLVEDCNELETQRDEAIARSNRLIAELDRCSGFHERLAEQRDDLIASLKEIASRLRSAGASIPAPEHKGTFESAIATGMSIALVLIDQAIEKTGVKP